MKLNFKLWVMTAVALFAMNSCTQDEEMSNMSGEKGTPVNFEFGIGAVTKTAMNDSYETDFEANDAVGIFQVDANGTVVSNAKYVLNAENNWVAEGTAIYAQEGTSYSYYAYYPYQEDVTDYTAIPITVSADQSNGFEANDALVANDVDVTAGSTTVALSFSHAFALVQVNLSGSEATDDAVVTLKNIMPTAKLNLSTKEPAAAEGVSTDVKMWQHATEKGIYRAIVPAQTIAQGNAILDIAVAKNYRFTWSQNVDYVKGAVRVINVTIGETPEQTTITIPDSNIDIDKWGNAEAAEGEGTGTEIIEYVNNVELQFTEGTSFTDVTGNWSSAPINFEPTDITWYHRELTTGTLTTPTFENNTLKLAAIKRGSWNASHVTCHYPGHFENDAVYQVDYTWSMGEETTAGIIGITVSNSDDSKRFLMRNKLDNTNSWNRNLTTNNSTVNALTFYLDFSQASTEGRADLKDYQETISTTTSEEISNGINITFYNYTTDTNNPSEVILNSFKITKLGKVSEVITE